MSNNPFNNRKSVFLKEFIKLFVSFHEIWKSNDEI